MKHIHSMRYLMAGGLLLSTAAAAYPWAAWLDARVMNGKVFGYYYTAQYDTLFSFGPAGADPATGIVPVGGLSADDGVLYGTTSLEGRAFALTANTKDKWSETVLAELHGVSRSPLTKISAHQLAGTEGNDVFLLTLGANTVTKQIIYTFAGGKAAAVPSSGITAGPGGSLYGTATYGPSGNGFVYELTPGPHGAYSETTLYAFHGGLGGSQPTGGVVFGPGGLLYGTTAYGGRLACTYTPGQNGCGVIYSLSSSGIETVLHSFAAIKEGAGPGELTVDSHDDIVGATVAGGEHGHGTIFRLAFTNQNTLAWSRIYSFRNGADGAKPNTKLAVDSEGAIYGAAQGGTSGLGTLFVAVPPLMTGAEWTVSVLHTFTGAPLGKGKQTDGAYPSGGVLIDANGAVYGVTSLGGSYGYGAAYRLYP